MRPYISIVAAVALCAAAVAQGPVVTAAHTSFTDSVTGSSMTIVDAGTSVTWLAGHGAPFTITSGMNSSAANAGAAFNAQLNAHGDTFTYLAASAGVTPYFSGPQESLGMTGTLIVNPVTSSHTVHAHHHRFFDSVTGGTITTIELGQSISWLAGANAPHTVTSGTGSADPASGALFQSVLLTAGDVFTFTPTSVGSIAYYCQEHEIHGMSGTIVVVPPPTRPGTGEDFVLESGINQAPGAIDVNVAVAGDVLRIRLDSPDGGYDFFSYAVAGQVFATATPPASLFPGIWITGDAFALIGFGSSPLGDPLMLPGGFEAAYPMPPLPSGTSLLLQGFMLTSSSANGIFVSTNAHEIQVL